jgi:ribosomal protein L11 methyltransferase
MGHDWVELTVRTSADSADVLALLNDPAVSGAWQEDGVVRLYWPASAWDAERVADLCAVLAGLGHSVTEENIAVGRLTDRDWNEPWAQAAQPVRIGRVVIRCSWHRVELAAGEVELIIDPKQAFGTGHHATTQLLIEWLQEIIRGGETVLDLGTGSGVLAMAALKLGASYATGVDHDPVAIDCARDYARQNGIGQTLVLEVANAVCLREPANWVNLLVANLDRQTIMECSDLLASYAQRGARLLLSGLLTEQVPEITQALAVNGIYVAAMRERDGWAAFDAAAGSSCENVEDDSGS